MWRSPPARDHRVNAPRGATLSELVIALAINGIVWGLIIALIALGLSIIFGLLDIINIAHGDFFMVGTVVAWAVVEVTGEFWLALALVPLFGLLMGSVIERLVIRPIKTAAALSIVAPFGLSSSEERREGKEGVSTGTLRGWRDN